MASVGKHIRRLRTEKHLTQEALAEKLFVTRQAVSAWETEKSLPDVDILERIAEALSVDVTEVIYGVRQAPDLRRIKRRWLSLGFLLACICVIVCMVPYKNGTLHTWKYGLRYHLWNINYTTSQEAVPGQWSVELDLKDLDSNVGKVLYEDTSGCLIVVSEVNKQAPYQYRVFFRAFGVYDRTGGQLVSGAISPIQASTSFIPSNWPAATASTAGLTRECPIAGFSGSLDRKDGNTFSFHLSSTDSRNQRVFYTAFLEEQHEALTLTVSNLTRLTTSRVNYWDIY